jgi:hypothetical protein
MMEIWQRVQALKDKQLTTLSREKQFTVVAVSSDYVQFGPDNGKGTIPGVPKRIIEHIAGLNLKPTELRQRIAREYPADHNSSYIAAIVHKVTKP